MWSSTLCKPVEAAGSLIEYSADLAEQSGYQVRRAGRIINHLDYSDHVVVYLTADYSYKRADFDEYIEQYHHSC